MRIFHKREKISNMDLEPKSKAQQLELNDLDLERVAGGQRTTRWVWRDNGWHGPGWYRVYVNK